MKGSGKLAVLLGLAVAMNPSGLTLKDVLRMSKGKTGIHPALWKRKKKK